MTKPRIALLVTLVLSLGIFLWLQMSGDVRESIPASVDRADKVVVTTPPLSDGSIVRSKPASVSGDKLASASSDKPASAPADKPEPPVVGIASFAQWAEQYAAADERTRESLMAEGKRLASVRRAEMKEWIRTDPEQALAQALAPSLRAQLPPEIAAGIEQVVSGQGFYGVLTICNHSAEEVADPDHAQMQHEIRQDVVFGETLYRGHIFGDREHRMSEEDAFLAGVAVGSDLALAEGDGWIQPDGTDAVVAHLGDESRRFASEAEAELWIETEIAAFGDPQAGEAFDLGAPPTGEDPPWDVTYDPNPVTADFRNQKGPKTIMMIYAYGSDQSPSAVTNDSKYYSPAQLRTQAETASRWFYDVSYRQTWFGNQTWDGTPGPEGEDYRPMVHVVHTPVQLLNQASYYGKDTFGVTRSHLRNAVRALGGEYASGGRLDPESFDRITFYMVGSSFGTGLAYVNSDFFWAGGKLDGGTAIHELGHNWGVYHANAWTPSAVNAAATKTGIARHPDNFHEEYGGAGDIMGGSGPFSVMFKQKLGFLEFSNAQGLTEVQTVTSGGVFRLFDHTDVDARNPTAALRGLYLPIDGFGSTDKHVILGFRHVTPQANQFEFYETWGQNAVEVLSDGTSVNNNSGSHYLDTSPFSYAQDDRPSGIGDDRDGAIPLGRTYSEPAGLNGVHLWGGFHVTPVARGQAVEDYDDADPANDTTHEWIDVKVVYNSEVSSNEVPEITSLTVSNPTPAVGESVTLNVSATDADSDDLFYWWKFHQQGASQNNLPQQTLSWDSPGEYYVSAHVSDGKGGVAIEGIKVTVGAPSQRYELRGRILRSGLPVSGAKLWISSPATTTVGELIHDAFSESDGSYRFTNLEPGTYTIRAVHPTFLEDMGPTSHTVTISSSGQFGRDFVMNVAPASSYAVSGRVLYAPLNLIQNRTFPLGGVEVGIGGQTTVTAMDGTFTMNNVPDGDNLIALSHPKYSFDPVPVTLNGADVNVGDLAPRLTSAWTRANNLPTEVPGTLRIVADGYPGWVQPDYYPHGDLYAGRLYVPSSDNSVEPPELFPVSVRTLIPGYQTTPTNYTQPKEFFHGILYTLDQDATADSAAAKVVQGTVTTSQGVPLEGVEISDGTTTVTTDQGGFYNMTTAGSGSVTITPSFGAYSFNPASHTLTMDEVLKTADFVLNTGSGSDGALPTVATAAAAVALDGKTIALSVLGADDGGEANLSYSWTKASGAGQIVFGANGGNTAKSTTATALAAGTYTFTCTIRDGLGNTVSSTTGSVTLTPALSSIVVSPGFTEVGLLGTVSFSAEGFDQFGSSVAVSPAFSVSGGGSIDSATGLFTADTLGDDVLVTATDGAVSGTAVLNVVPAKPTVEIISQGIGFTGTPYVFAANASDTDGSVAKVEFYIDGLKVGEDTTAPYTYEVAEPVIGLYELLATAIDNEGFATSTQPFALYIVNPMPGILRFNIEPESYSPTPDGFLKLDQTVRSDFQPANGWYYGWENKNTNASKFKEWNSGSVNPGSFPDEAHDTYVEMDKDVPFRVRVPNGTYSVRLVQTSLTTGNLSVDTDINGVRVIDETWDRSANPVLDRTIENVEVTDNWIRIFNPQYNQLWAFIEIIPDGAIVSVAASGEGSENGPTPIDFTLTREANFTESFVLNFSLGGTATAADYTVSGADTWNAGTGTGTVNFAPEQTGQVITLTPVQDSDLEGTETVQFTIEDGIDYAAGVASATAGILDAQTDYPPTVELVSPANGSILTGDLGTAHVLEVSATDDAFEGFSLVYLWEKISGPGSVTFSAPGSAATTATLGDYGTYVLRATVADAATSEFVEVTVTAIEGLGPESVYYINAGENGYSSDGTNEWNEIDLASGSGTTSGDNSDPVTIEAFPLADSLGLTARGITLAVTPTGIGSTSIVRHDTSQANLSGDPFDWFNPAAAGQRETFVFKGDSGSQYWIYTFAGFDPTDTVRFEFVVRRDSAGGDRLTTLSGGPAGGALTALYTNQPTDESPQYVVSGELTGSTSYEFRLANSSPSETWCPVPNAIAVFVEEAAAAPLTAAESWRDEFFDTTANSGDGADDNDFDGDGVVNLLERAFKTDPTDSSSVNLPSGEVMEEGGSEYLSITYRRLVGGTGTTGVNYTAAGITYTVEYDEDLVGTWSSGDVTAVGTPVDNEDGTETVTVRLDSAIGERGFIRVRVSGE